MLIRGKWHSKGSAAQSCSTLFVTKDVFKIETEEGVSYEGKLDDLAVRDRLGNVERKVTLDDGSIFSTHDNAAIDDLFIKNRKIFKFVHAFEAHMGWVVLVLMFIVFSFIVFFKWGVPWICSQIAHNLPLSTHESNN